MKLDISKIELDRDDLNTLHDVVYDALFWSKETPKNYENIKHELTDEKLIGYWNELPDHIKLDAVHWGISDTPTKDAMYVWLQVKYKK